MLLRDISRSYVSQTVVVASGGIAYLLFGSTAGLVVAAVTILVLVFRFIQQFLRV
ncbi:hypothetical protein [Rhodopirellula bahusiensis]|uniref:hypothetical protein n=1 Tax=Rhodopirellula bahusiensis TaxID=2014065 RepID=UPI0018ECF809|nr:hypothetical protein [Rhodopirellula bahusiensis]